MYSQSFVGSSAEPNKPFNFRGLFGASKGDFVLENINSSGSTHGSSRIFPSADMCNKFASTLKGASPLLSLGTFI